MKKIISIAMMALVVVMFGSCKSSKKNVTPIDTYVMPCSEFTTNDGILRAWASGSSDNESTARKKALATASNELAGMLSKTVASTTEDYSTALAGGEAAISKSFLNEKIKVTVEKTISGATIVCDRWHKADNGQYTNYIVLELKGEEYLKTLYEEISKNTTNTINKDLLEQLFMKNINESINK